MSNLLSGLRRPGACASSPASVLCVILALSVGLGCAASRPEGRLRAEFTQAAVVQPAPPPLQDNHFRSDRTGNLTEDQLKAILDAPLFLEQDARLGIVPVATAYEVDPELPVAIVPHMLGRALEDTGFFEITTEISTDWPSDRSVAGLRELAARYRAKYLLLYRHRFIEQSWTNAWGWAYLTGVGAIFAPGRSVETAGVLEATLFDARTGTLLFTVYERVHQERAMTLWNNDVKRRAIKGQLLTQAADKLSAQVSHKVRRLVAARHAPASPAASSSSSSSSSSSVAPAPAGPLDPLLPAAQQAPEVQTIQ